MKIRILLYSFAAWLSVGCVMAAGGASLGVQLYSVRDQAKTNPDQALATVESWGVTDVETAGLSGTAADFAAKLSAHQLRAVSAHYPFERLDKDMDAVIAEARTLGVQYVICPSLAHGAAGFGVRDATRVAEAFNRFGLKLRSAGIKFGYHTHGFEFTPEAGETPMDILIRNTDPSLVCFEMDVFWVWSAGEDPQAWLRRYPNRWALVHLKDMRVGAPRTMHGSATAADNVAVGAGQIPWPQLIPAFKAHGVRYFFIEDETSDPLKNVPASLAYLKQLGGI